MLRIPSCGVWFVVWGAACLSVSLATQAVEAASTPIYGVGVDNKIYAVDTAAQSIAFVANSLSSGVKANGFAADRMRDQLMYFGSSGDLLYYDVALTTSGTVATASAFGITSDFPPEDAAYHADAFWYVAKGDAANNILYKAPLTYSGGVPSLSGPPIEYQLTVAGSSSGMQFGDIVVNELTGRLYGSTTPVSGGMFFSLDMSALVAGTANPVAVISTSNTVGLQLAFSEDYSVLFGQRYIFDPLDPANPALTSGAWYTVDPLLGAYAAIPGFITTPGMRDLAGTVAPEPGSCLLATLGACGILLLRRRRSGGSAVIPGVW